MDFQYHYQSSIKLPWRHVRSHTKFGHNRFSRFDVYLIQTDRQTSVKYLQNVISDERKKNKTLERNIREQLCDEFNEMLVEVNKSALPRLLIVTPAVYPHWS